MADRRDEVDHRVSEDRSAGFDLAQLRGAYPGERPDDSDKVLIGPVAREIFGLLAARLPDVAPPKCLSKYLPLFQRDWPPPDVAPAARLASPRSDVRQDALSPQAARTESQQGAPERHSEKHLEALPSFPQVVAEEQLVLQAFRAMQQPLAQPVSARLEPLQEPPLEPDASS